jgi:uncharacterized protein YkwD
LRPVAPGKLTLLRLAAITLLVLLGGLAQTGVAAARPNALELALVHEINDAREEHALRPLTMSPKLGASAAEHTREMGAQGYFEHDSRDATPFWMRIQHWYPSRGQRFWSVGENLSWSRDAFSARRAVAAWMASQAHRVNVLSRTWREIGISAIHFDSAPGKFAGTSVTLVTADFGTRR